MGLKEKAEGFVGWLVTVAPAITAAKEAVPAAMDIVGRVREEIAAFRSDRQSALAEYLAQLNKEGIPQEIIMEAMHREYSNSRSAEAMSAFAQILGQCMVANMRHANGEDADEGKE